jgi:benzoyl-CoA reductase/2-hydroxyglutaryl-CoA dehydratase subunit BcrC/BadD/HgdB
MNDGERARKGRFLAKIGDKLRAEKREVVDALVSRPDFRPELAYFLELGQLQSTAVEQQSLALKIEARVQRPVAALLCLQAPLELFYALDIHPFKVYSGSSAVGQLASSGLPAVMCPPVKALLAEIELDCSLRKWPWVIPTTCHWVTKFPDQAAFFGGLAGPVHFLEVPKVKESAQSQQNWLREVYALADFLRTLSKVNLTRSRLLAAAKVFQKVRKAFFGLLELRRAGKVPAVWFYTITGSFFLDRAENWAAALEKALTVFDQMAPANNQASGPGIFLSGSPIYFPNFKLLRLLETVSLPVLADDLCSGERFIPRHLAIADPSEGGIMRALAETYLLGCQCPIFANSERRLSSINLAAQEAHIKGVIFHLLKGCHCFDQDSLTLENRLNKEEFSYLRLETDYSPEDSHNLLTRLEAFQSVITGRGSLASVNQPKRSSGL